MKKARLLLLLIPVVAGLLYLRSLAARRPQTVFAQPGWVSHLAFSSDGKTLLVAQKPSFQASKSAHLTALDATRSFQSKWSLDNSMDFGKPQFFAKDAQVLVNKWHVKALDSATGKTRRDFELSEEAVMSPNGRWLAHYKSVEDRRLTVRPLSTKPNPELEKLLTKTLGQRGQGIGLFCFSPDSKRFVMTVKDATGMHLEFYDTANWRRTGVVDDLKPKPTAPFPFYDTLQWSRDGQYLLSHWFSYEAMASEDSLTLWDTRNLSKRVQLKNVPIPGAALTLQNRDLVYGTALGTIVTRRLADNYSQATELLRLPKDSVTAVTLSPDGTTLFAGTQGGRVIWKRVK